MHVDRGWACSSHLAGGTPLDGGGGWCQVPVALEPWEDSIEAVTRATSAPRTWRSQQPLPTA